MADAIVSVVLERFEAIAEEKIRGEVGLLRGVKEEVVKLSSKLETVRSVLKDAERRGVMDESVKGWLKKLEDTAYEMDDILDEWNYHAIHASLKAKAKVRFPFRQSSCFAFKKVGVRRGIAKKIENVKASLDEILEEKNKFNFETIMPPADSTPQPETLPIIEVEKVVGEDVERKKTDIVGRLMMDGDSHQVLGIVGMGGIGKTTLAQLVYNDIQVQDCFALRIWICVSDPFDVAGIARGIIEYAGSTIASDITQSGVILQKLQDCISGKKFLLVLDDVWTHNYSEWEPLIVSLRCGAETSKILVTTRKDSVAQMMGVFEDKIIRPKLLEDDECWSLLRRISFRGKTECGEFEGVGKDLAKRCKGLPLAVNILGNVLHSKNSLEEWENVLESEIWELDEEEKLYPHLLLSYRELSPQLKLCFSYCSVYPKDTELEVESLITQWVALGYLDSVKGNGGMELKGRDYFNKLATRSLFQDFEKDDATEQIISCKMHDIVHDFAQSLRNNGVTKTCRVCNNVLDSHVQAYRTLFWDELSHRAFCDCFTSLRVLKYKEGYIWRQYEISLHGVEKLIHLRWLDVTENKMSKKDMKTICKLYYLQSLSLRRCSLEDIPHEIGNLVELRHIYLTANTSLKVLPEEIYSLIKLQTLVLPACSLENIPHEIVNLVDLRHIDLSENKSLKVLPEETYSLIKLQTLVLKSCSLKEISEKIENLVELRYLNLSGNAELKVLPRNITKLIKLHTLLLGRCSLEEIPHDIGNLINLRCLNLEGNNEIEKLPEGISGMVKLQCINHCTNLRRLPQGFASLCGLRRLDWFIGGSGLNRVGLLKNFNSLEEDLRLCISVSSDSSTELVEDVREAELKKKTHLRELRIEFKSISERNDQGECSSSSPSPSLWLWVDLLEALEPYQNLLYLAIRGYMGSRLPNWLSSPHNQISRIYLYHCNELVSLPSMGKLPFLEQLYIEGMEKLEVLGVEWLGIRGGEGDAMDIQSCSSLVTFPKLRNLSIIDCVNWLKWEDITGQEEESSAVSVMPCLKYLNLDNCAILNELPHRLLRKLSSLEKLIVSRSTELFQRYGDEDGSDWRSISRNNPKLRIMKF